MSPRAAGSAGSPRRPRNWANAVAAAYLRAIGGTQKAAAEAAGCSERTLRTWEGADWWPDAMEEARDRWLVNLTAAARGTLLKVVSRGNAQLALAVLERLDLALAPATVRVDLNAMDPKQLTDDELAAIAAGADPATVLGRRKHGRR